MISAILFILLAWFVEMPLWLSIFITIFASVILLIQIVKISVNAYKDYVKRNSEDD